MRVHALAGLALDAVREPLMAFNNVPPPGPSRYGHSSVDPGSFVDTGNPGAFVVPFGPYKDQTLHDIANMGETGQRQLTYYRENARDEEFRRAAGSVQDGMRAEHESAPRYEATAKPPRRGPRPAPPLVFDYDDNSILGP